MNKNRLPLGVFIVVIWSLLWVYAFASSGNTKYIISETEAPQTVIKSQVECPVITTQSPFQVLEHRVEVWLSVLEWCESGGRGEAINPKDKDGTPSYFWFQFKPSTFKGYGIKYKIFSKEITDEQIEVCMKDYELTKRIVRLMVYDKQVDLSNEFPACLRKIGNPPRV